MQSIDSTVNPLELTEILSHLIPAGQPVMIVGRPGIGKSDIVAQACEKAGFELIISHPVVSDPVDYKGLPMLGADGKHAEFVPFSELTMLINADKPTVFFLDDLGQATPAVQAACMQLLLARRINGYKISDQVTFVAATNRREDKAGVSGILSPVKSRFAIFNLEADLKSWVDWALDQEWFPLELIAAVRFKPQWVTDWSPAKKGAIVNTPTPRNIEYIGKMMGIGIPNNLMFPVFVSRLGQAAAVELQGFIRFYKDLPSVKTIVNNPTGAPVPRNKASLYGLVGALVGAATLDNFEALMTYIRRTPMEYQVLMVKDIQKRKKEVTSTNAFFEWALENQNIIA